jgi:hypothetical protein
MTERFVMTCRSVNTLLTVREKLGCESMPVDQKKSIDATIEVREKCIEKGFFK